MKKAHALTFTNSILFLSTIALVGLGALLTFSAFSARAEVGPEVTTTIHTAGHASVTQAAIGTMVHANAKVASTTATTTMPTGTVDFNRYLNTSCSGTPVVQVVALSNGEAESTATSVPATGLSYRVTYNGDATSTPSQGSCTALTATASDTSITTNLSSSTVMAGTAVHDTAQLHSITSNASGTVAYKVFTNNSCSAGAQSAGVKTVVDGNVPNSDSITFNTPGTFYWQAVYSGDSQNVAATSSCQSEVLQVLSTSTPTGRIIVDKVTNPTSATASFHFITDGAGYGDFDLTNSAAPNDQTLAVGTYRIRESALSGWKLTSAQCSRNGATSTNYTQGSNLTLGANDTISCTFLNTQKATSTDDDDDGDDDDDKPPFFKKFLPFGIWKKIFGDDDFPLPPGIEKSFNKVFKNWDHDDDDDDDDGDDDDDDDDNNRKGRSNRSR